MALLRLRLCKQSQISRTSILDLSMCGLLFPTTGSRVPSWVDRVRCHEPHMTSTSDGGYVTGTSLIPHSYPMFPRYRTTDSEEDGARVAQINDA